MGCVWVVGCVGLGLWGVCGFGVWGVCGFEVVGCGVWGTLGPVCERLNPDRFRSSLSVIINRLRLDDVSRTSANLGPALSRAYDELTVSCPIVSLFTASIHDTLVFFGTL